MIIQVLSNVYDEGYLDKKDTGVTAPFFNGGNVAFRRKALEDVGPYDTACQTGEDIDICMRLLKTDWELYYEPRAVVQHRFKTTLPSTLGQWLRYGLYHPYVYKKHSDCAIEVFSYDNRGDARSLFKKVFYRAFPVRVVIFLTDFLLMHLYAGAAVISFLSGWQLLAWLFGTLALIRLVRYLRQGVPGRTALRRAQFVCIRYAVNTVIMITNFVGGLARGMVYLYGTHEG